MEQQFASIESIQTVVTERESKMGIGHDELLEQWLLYGLGLTHIRRLTELQVRNLMCYMRDHDAEQIVAHIMDLAPRQVPA